MFDLLTLLATELTWWQLGLLIIYTLYTLIRAYFIYDDGLKNSLLGYQAEEIRLYHLIWAVVDVPAILLGKIYPAIKYIFSVPVFPLKQKKSK